MIMEGRSIKQKILDELKEKIQKENIHPSFTVIQVGNDPASNIYIKTKQKMAEYIGYTFNHLKFDNISEEELLKVIDKLNNDNNVDGILVQMPLPDNINSNIILNRINPNKDIDGLTDINSGKMFHQNDALLPCTPLGIMNLLDYYHIDPTGLHVVVVGRSNLVGKPIANMLLNKGATVSICHSKTNNLSKYTKDADILIAAVGKKHLIKSDMVKDNSIIIDVGINRVDDKLYGDVDFDNIKDKAKYITPVPGGVGQMTIAALAQNIYKAYKINNE